jgi:hypothetical protein
LCSYSWVGNLCFRVDRLCAKFDFSSLWGNPNHFWCLKTYLREKYPKERIHILVPKRNTGSLTCDGIETGAERVTLEIEEALQALEEQGERVTKISIIGYSLGGLIARYCVGVLHSRGWFDKLQPVNFTTFATPHLGVRTPLLGWHNHIWNVTGARTLSMSGRQLFMVDNFRSTGRPLLSILADESSTFVSGLRLFKNRSLYANIINDRTVPFYTSYITPHDPFVHMNAININYLPGSAPIILDPANPVSRKTSPLSLNERLASNARTFYKRLPLFIFFIVFVPIGTILFLINSVVLNVKSSKRIRLHEEGKLGVRKGAYRSLPLFVNDLRRAAESAFENVAAEHTPEYLPQDSPIAVPRRGSIVSNRSGYTTGSEDDEKPLLLHRKTHSFTSTISICEEPETMDEEVEEEEEEDKKDEFPTLALTPAQFKAIDVLDQLNWRKYAVHLHQVNHTHAAIIVRMNRKAFAEGKVVLKHWLENFEG